MLGSFPALAKMGAVKEAFKAKSDRKIIWDDDQFRERCAVAAARKGWSLEDLCDYAGIDRYYLNTRPAHGRRIDAIMSIAKAAEVSLHWLVTFDQSVPLISHTDLPRLADIANVVAYLYLAMSLQRSDMDANDIVRSVMDMLGRRINGGSPKPELAPSASKEVPTTPDAGESRPGRTSRVRSNSR